MDSFCKSATPPAFVSRRVAHSGDADAQAKALIFGDWDQRYDQLSAGRFDGSMHEIRFSSFTLMRETTNRILLQRGCLPAGVFAIGAMLSPDDDAYFAGEPIPISTATLLKPGSEFEIRTPERFDLIAAVFSPRDLVNNLDDPTLDYRELELDLGRSPKIIGSPHVAQLLVLLQRLYACFQEWPENVMSPSSQRQIEEEFFSLLADTLHQARGPDAHTPCPNRERIVRRFKALVDDYPEVALSIVDICKEIGVTRRTLQYATQQLIGISPQHYLKAVRLNAFRRALRVRDPHRESIGDVAARWGFWHLSQLAQDYRKLFGELPSQTPCAHVS